MPIDPNAKNANPREANSALVRIIQTLLSLSKAMNNNKKA